MGDGLHDRDEEHDVQRDIRPGYGRRGQLWWGNWLPITTLAIMLGVDFVRVGMEDHLWVYPYKDEKIRRNADMTRKIANIGRELGRETGTPDEARKLLGLE